MADLNSSLESLGLSAEEETTTATTTTAASTSTAVASSCEAMLWEGWSSHPSSSTTDEASTSNMALLPELTTPTSFTPRFHHHSDMLCNLLSSFHPLAVHPQTSEDNATFLHQLDHSESEGTTVFFGEPSKVSTYFTGIPYPLLKRDDQVSQWKASEWAQTIPEPRDFMKWDATPWPGTTTIQLFHDEDDTSHMRDEVVTGFGQAHQTSKKLELFSNFGTVADQQSEMNPVLVLSPQMNQTSSTAWIPTSTPDRAPDRVPELPFTRSQQLLDSVRTAQDHQRSVTVEPSEQVAVTSLGGAPRKQNRRGGDEFWNRPASKRLHVANERAGTMMWRNHDSREDFAIATGMRRVVDSSSCRSGGVWTTNGASSSSTMSASASQAIDLFAMGPALNTNGKPRARRGSATDPQSVYARHRREKINERLKTLQHLVPNGTKVDIVTMLDEAVQYVQFLQLQLQLLESEKLWTLATPNVYKGIDLTHQPRQMQGMESSASLR